MVVLPSATLCRAKNQSRPNTIAKLKAQRIKAQGKIKTQTPKSNVPIFELLIFS
jgi:hypothetical protein